MDFGQAKRVMAAIMRFRNFCFYPSISSAGGCVCVFFVQRTKYMDQIPLTRSVFVGTAVQCTVIIFIFDGFYYPRGNSADFFLRFPSFYLSKFKLFQFLLVSSFFSFFSSPSSIFFLLLSFCLLRRKIIEF
jgi:hypothetical protein